MLESSLELNMHPERLAQDIKTTINTGLIRPMLLATLPVILSTRPRSYILEISSLINFGKSSPALP